MTTLFKSPEDYLLTMIERVQAAGSRLTDFTQGSAVRTFYEGLAAGLSEQSLVAEQLRQDSYLATATGDALDAKAADYQVTRVAAVPAGGNIKITRSTSGTAVTIPAGWGELVTVPAPGETPVSYLTIADAEFGIADTEVTVAATAVDGGQAGNISQGALDETQLLPVNPVTGFSTETGFVALGPFTGGVDQETDDALRARVPIAVEGRVKGRAASYLAAVLAVAGVESAQVRQAGETNHLGGTISNPNVNVYVEADTDLTATLEEAVDAASTLNQTPNLLFSTGVPCTVDLEVFVLPGTDTDATQEDVEDLLLALVNGTGVGETAYLSTAIQQVAALTDVVSLDLPFNDFRESADTDGVAADIVMGVGEHATLDIADLTVTVTEL